MWRDGVSVAFGFRKAHGATVPFLTTPAYAFSVDDAGACTAAAFVIHGGIQSVKHSSSLSETKSIVFWSVQKNERAYLEAEAGKTVCLSSALIAWPVLRIWGRDVQRAK